MILCIFECDWHGAECAFQRAQQLDPAGVQTCYWYGIMLGTLGRGKDAMAQARRAEAVDPVSPYTITGAGLVQIMARTSDGPTERLDKALDLRPDFFPALFWRGWAHSVYGRHAEALSDARRLRSLTGNATPCLIVLAAVLARGGEHNEARTLLDELDDRAPYEYVSPLWLAVLLACLDEPDRAMHALEQACEERNAQRWMLCTPFYDDLRSRLGSHPRFQVLLHRMNFPETATSH